MHRPCAHAAVVPQENVSRFTINSSAEVLPDVRKQGESAL